MKQGSDILEKRACISYVKDGTCVLSESEISMKGETLIYRLSVEPRPFLRKDAGEVFYTVTVERIADGERATASLRDFSCERSEAEAFYRRLFSERVTPENLRAVCAGE